MWAPQGGEDSLGKPPCKELTSEAQLKSKPGPVLRKEAWLKGVGAAMAALLAQVSFAQPESRLLSACHQPDFSSFLDCSM